MCIADACRSTPYEELQARKAAWIAAGDRRHLFADVYSLMTGAMIESLDTGIFLDRAWVQRLVDVFLEYYLRAVDGATSGGDCPAVWADAFAACERQGENPLGVAMLGINAHINHDLVFALRDVLEDWDDLDQAARDRRFTDYNMVNQIIADNIDHVQDEVIEPLLPGFELFDKVLGRADEWAFGRVVTAWRQEVWEDTLQLLAARTDEQLQRVNASVVRRADLTARVIALL